MPERCLNCRHSGKDCIPHLMALAATDLIAWCKDRKKQLDLSNADIAERSNVPKGTVDRIFGKEVFTEFRFSTIQPIIRVLTGCKMEDLDCMNQTTPDQALLNTIEKQNDYIKSLEKENAYLSKQEEHYEKEYKRLEMQYQTQIDDFKKERKILQKGIAALAAALAVGIVATIIISI